MLDGSLSTGNIPPRRVILRLSSPVLVPPVSPLDQPRSTNVVTHAPQYDWSPVIDGVRAEMHPQTITCSRVSRTSLCHRFERTPGAGRGGTRRRLPHQTPPLDSRRRNYRIGLRRPRITSSALLHPRGGSAISSGRSLHRRPGPDLCTASAMGGRIPRGLARLRQSCQPWRCSAAASPEA